MSDQNVMSEEAWQLFQDRLQAEMEKELASQPRGNTGMPAKYIIRQRYESFGLGKPAPAPAEPAAPTQEELRAAYEAEITEGRKRIGWSQSQALELRAEYRRKGLSI